MGGGGGGERGGGGGGGEVRVGVGEALEVLLVHGGQHVGVGGSQRRGGRGEELVEVLGLLPTLRDTGRAGGTHTPHGLNV